MKTVYIVLTFCAGLFLGYLIFPNHHSITTTSTAAIALTENKLQAIDTAKQAATVKLQLRNNQLAKSLLSMSALLADSKEKLASERSRVTALTAQLTCKSDSLVVDSLCSEIATLNHTTDSIIHGYEQKDSIRQCVVAIRDSELVVCNASYNQVKDLLREQEQKQLQLTADLNTAIKENKKIRFKNRLLAAGALFISGIVATLYIKSK